MLFSLLCSIWQQERQEPYFRYIILGRDSTPKFSSESNYFSHRSHIIGKKKKKKKQHNTLLPFSSCELPPSTVVPSKFKFLSLNLWRSIRNLPNVVLKKALWPTAKFYTLRATSTEEKFNPPKANKLPNLNPSPPHTRKQPMFTQCLPTRLSVLVQKELSAFQE